MAGVHRRRCLLVRRPHATVLVVAVAAAGMALAVYSAWPRGAPAPIAASVNQDFAVGAPTWQVYPAGHPTAPGPVSGELLDGTGST